jgi:hypothetical protein
MMTPFLDHQEEENEKFFIFLWTREPLGSSAIV